MDVLTATEVFVKAIVAGKSRTYPYSVNLVDGIWVMRDTPTRKNQRKSTLVALEKEPSQVVSIAQSQEVGWHFVIDIDADSTVLDSRAKAYKALNYRKLSTIWLFTHDLTALPNFTSDPPARLVASQADLTHVRQRASQPRYFIPGAELFGIWDDEGDKGWVRNFTHDKIGYVDSLHVHEEFRRRGYGASLMTKLLHDNKERGLEASFLTSSAAGALLYPKLGYKLIATAQFFCPRDR